MASSGIKRIGILTAGGDCPGLNVVIRVVAKAAIQAVKEGPNDTWAAKITTIATSRETWHVQLSWPNLAFRSQRRHCPPPGFPSSALVLLPGGWRHSNSFFAMSPQTPAWLSYWCRTLTPTTPACLPKSCNARPPCRWLKHWIR